ILSLSIFCFYLIFFLLCFFFFQAEDGIRDPLVTGVQTCALPICPSCESRYSVCGRPQTLYRLSQEGRARFVAYLEELEQVVRDRSEERRVGKECRSGRSASR